MVETMWTWALTSYWACRIARFQKGSVIEVRHAVPSGQTYTHIEFSDDSTLSAIERLSNQPALMEIARQANVHRYSDTETPLAGETFGTKGYFSPVLQAALPRMTASSLRSLLEQLEPGEENPLEFEWKVEHVRKRLDWIEVNGNPDLSRAAPRARQAKASKPAAPQRRPVFTSIMLSAIACCALPFVAAFLGEGLGVRELEGRRLDGVLAELARDLGIWPAFVALFVAGFPPAAIIASRWQGRAYIRENLAALVLAWLVSVTIWMFFMPWSAAESAAGIVWSGVMGTLYPLLNWAILAAGLAVFQDLQEAHEP